MKSSVCILRALADENRLRLLMLLRERELFVCQLMAVLGISQPLVSRNLALLERQGLLDSRRQGKHVFYSLKKDLPRLVSALLDIMAAEGGFDRDRRNMDSFCRDFLRGGECDMRAVRAFMESQNKNKK